VAKLPRFPVIFIVLEKEPASFTAAIDEVAEETIVRGVSGEWGDSAVLCDRDAGPINVEEERKWLGSISVG
jgi:hypothetical protein